MTTTPNRPNPGNLIASRVARMANKVYDLDYMTEWAYYDYRRNAFYNGSEYMGKLIYSNDEWTVKFDRSSPRLEAFAPLSYFETEEEY